jgi:predicted enzyme related to lactoylglutathione lyase
MDRSNFMLFSLCLLFLVQSCNRKDEGARERNRVTWFSIPTDDLKRASKFYQTAFNWQVQPLTPEHNDDFSFMTMLNSDSDINFIPDEKGSVNGCLVKRKIGLPTPAILVEVSNLDEAIKKVTNAGGTVLTEKIVMKSLNGVFVLIKDTEGNYVEVFQSL